MQVQGGAAAEAAITSFERKFIVDIRVDWDGDGSFDHPFAQLGDYIEDVNLDRAFAGAAPDELMIVDGAAAAELVFTIGGEYNGIPLTTVFSPFNSRSLLYGKKRAGAEITYAIIVDTDAGPVRYQQFVGKIVEITPNRGENRVEIIARDRAQELRKPVRLPTWAVSDEHVNYGETASQLAYSHWVIGHALRLCDVSNTPKRPVYREEQNVPDEGLDGVQLWVSGDGSYLPTIGYLDNPNADSFPKNTTPMYRLAAQRHPLTDDDSLYGRPMGLAGLGLPIQQRYSQPSDQGIIRYWSADQDKINPTARHFMGFTLNTNNTNGTSFQTVGDVRVLEVYIGMGRALEVWVGAGKVWSRRVDYSNGGAWVATGKVNIPTGRSNVDVHVEWDNTTQTGSRCYVRAGDNVWLDTLGTPVTSGSNLGADQIKGRVTIGQALNMSDIYYAVRNYYTQSTNITNDAWRPAKYAAVLDIGKNRFTHMPSDDTYEAWELIKDVAAAEWGAVFWDEQGIFHFWNTDTIQDMQAETVRTVNLDDVTGLQVTENFESVKNVYTVKTAKKRAVMQGGVYESNDVNEFYVPARTQRKFRIFKDDVLSPLTFKMGKFMSKEEYLSGTTNFPVWGDNVSHGYCVQYQNADTGEWRELHDREGVDVRVYFTTGGMLTVDIYNGWEEPIRLAGGSATDDPQAMFRVAGTIVFDDDTKSVITRDRDSIAKYGSQNLELEGTWHQDTFGANEMITEALANSREPKPTTDAITIAGDPRLQLGDTLGITDPGGFGDGLRVQIIGIGRSYSRDEGLTDTLTVELLNPDPEALPTAPSAPTGLSAVFLAPRTVQLQWNEVPNATSYKLYDEINEPAGVAKDGIVLTTSQVRELTDGNYRFKVSAVNLMGESAFSNVVAITAPTGSTTPTADAPYQVLNIGPTAGKNHFKLGVDYAASLRLDKTQAEIAAGYTVDPWFKLNAEKNGVQFSVPLDGGAGTYPKSELTEVNLDGTAFTFNPSTGTHYIQGKVRITSLPPTKPQVVFAELINGTEDIVQLSTQLISGVIQIVCRINGTSTGLPKLATSYSVGSEFQYRIEVNAGTLKVFYNDLTTPVISQALSVTTNTCFFKTGCYGQSNETIDSITGTTFKLEIRDLQHWHTGWATPSTNPTAPTQVAVNAGADASVATGALINRTATVANSSASGTWQVVAAPTTAGSTDLTQAAIKYGWGEPLTAWSDEFNYTGTPLSAKWSLPGTDWAGHSGNGRRRPERQTVDGSKLVMTGLANGDSGWMASKFNQQYGKWECRVRSFETGTDNGNNYHVLLIIWPQSDEWPEGGEYDFLELSKPGQTGYDSYTHYPHDADVSVQQIRVQSAGIDFSQWRNVAIEWDSTGIQLYVDGNKIGSKMSGGANSSRQNIQDMASGHLTIQLDNFDGTSQTPASYEVDWARVYPRVPQGNTSTGGTSIVGTTIGTSATLAWTPPVDGQYTLRYTLSTGEYDEFELTVGGSGTPAGSQLPDATVRQWKSASSPSPYTAKANAVVLDQTAVTGDLLVYALAGDKNTGTLTMADNIGSAGWTVEVSQPSASVSLYVARKVAVGGEKTITGTTVNSPVSGNAWVAMELQQTGAPSWGVSAKSVGATDETNVSSKSTGTTGTIAYRGLSLAVAAIDSAMNMTNPNFSGHTVLFASPTTSGDGGGGAGLVVATASAAPGGTMSSTFSKSGSNDQISTALVVLGRQGNA